MIVEHPLRRASRIGGVVLGGAVIGAPFYWLLITALKPAHEAMRFPPSWVPSALRWANIPEGFALLGAQVFLNSLMFTVAVTGLQLCLVMCGGFALAKLRFPGRRVVFAVMLGTMFVPFHVVLVPTFLVVHGLGMVGSWPGLVLPIVAQTAFGTFLFKQFFDSLPGELIDAATIDGADWGQIFRRIVVPLAGPPTAAYVSITAVNAWNMYVWPLVATFDETMRVLPLKLAGYGGEYGTTPPNLLMMAVLLSVLPTLAVLILAQKYFINGIGGALKE